MRKRSQRLWMIGAAGVLVAGALALGATAFNDTAAFFYLPSDVAAKDAAQPGKSARIGGIVEVASVRNIEDAHVTFRITDGTHAIPIVYGGLLPDLFEEGQQVVAVGKFDEHGGLIASRVLAKHDENYKPKEVDDALREKQIRDAFDGTGVGG